MSALISVLIIVICILLILVVLVQNPKGGGLASNLSSSNQVMGVRKTADFLEKATWTLAIALVVLSLLTTMVDQPTGEINNASEIQEQIDNEPLENVPQMPETPTPANGE